MESAEANDDRLAKLLDDLTQKHRRGATPDIEHVAEKNPELADELRQLWAAVLVTETLARRARDSRATADFVSPSPSAGLSMALPRSFGDYELHEEIGRGAM